MINNPQFIDHLCHFPPPSAENDDDSNQTAMLPLLHQAARWRGGRFSFALH